LAYKYLARKLLKKRVRTVRTFLKREKNESIYIFHQGTNQATFLHQELISWTKELEPSAD